MASAASVTARVPPAHSPWLPHLPAEKGLHLNLLRDPTLDPGPGLVATLDGWMDGWMDGHIVAHSLDLLSRPGITPPSPSYRENVTLGRGVCLHLAPTSQRFFSHSPGCSFLLRSQALTRCFGQMFSHLHLFREAQSLGKLGPSLPSPLLSPRLYLFLPSFLPSFRPSFLPSFLPSP